jgi:hypothetical protein
MTAALPTVALLPELSRYQQRACEQAIGATGTPWAPWTIVPADSETHRNLMITRVLKATLQGLRLRLPEGDPALKKLKVR